MTDEKKPANRAADSRNNIMRARANKPGAVKPGLSAGLPQRTRPQAQSPQLPAGKKGNTPAQNNAQHQPKSSQNNVSGQRTVPAKNTDNNVVGNKPAPRAPESKKKNSAGNADIVTPGNALKKKSPSSSTQLNTQDTSSGKTSETEGSYYGSLSNGSVYDEIDIDMDDLFDDEDEIEMLRQRRRQKQINRAQERASLSASATSSTPDTSSQNNSNQEQDAAEDYFSSPYDEHDDTDPWEETQESQTDSHEESFDHVADEDLPPNAIRVQNDDGTTDILFLDDDPYEEETSGNNGFDDDNIWGDDTIDNEGSRLEDVDVDDLVDPLDDEDPLALYEEEDDDINVLDMNDEFTESDEDEIKPGQSVFRGYDINAILAVAFEEGASDIDIIPYQAIAFKKLGEVFRRKDFATPADPVPDGRTTREMQQYILSDELSQRFIRVKEVDTSYVVRLEKDTLPQYRHLVEKYKGRRLRVSVGHTNENIYMTFRTITDKVPTPQELGIEGDMLRWASLPRGLILINGSTGSGKSTTLSSLIRQEQLRSRKKFITIENPVEFMYPDDGESIVVQREVGKDTDSFESGLNSAMREAPDVILIGEVRDKTEALALLKASDTGHLALSTMHTKDVATTISRVRKIFEGDGESSALASLSDALKGIANQILLKTPDGKSRFAVRETLVVDDEVRALIAEGDAEGVRRYQREHRITLEHELARVTASGRCSMEAALIHTERVKEFDEYFVEEMLKSSEKGSQPVYELPETELKYEGLLKAQRGSQKPSAAPQPRPAPKKAPQKPARSLPTRLP